MKVEGIFRFWMLTSAFWVVFSLMVGGKRWEFPARFEECWMRQRVLLQQTWTNRQIPDGKQGKIKYTVLDDEKKR